MDGTENASKGTILYFDFLGQASLYICLSHIKMSHLAALDRTSPDVCGASRVTNEGGTRGRSGSETPPSLSPQDPSAMPSRSQWPVLARLSPSLLGVLPQGLPPPSLCKCRHVWPGHGPIPLSKRVQRTSYKKKKKKINTGIRCHLVSRPANTSLGTVPVPQCTNPTSHLLRFAGIGRQDTAFFCTDPGAAFVSHDCLSLADCLPPYVIAGKLLSTSGGEKQKTAMQNLTVF